MAPTKVRVPEGTEVPLLFVDTLSSATNGEGDRFTLRVDGDVRVGGLIVIKSGSIAVGVVSNAHKRGFMGKAGELNVVLDHVMAGDDRIKLRASKGKTGDAKVGATVALTITGRPLRTTWRLTGMSLPLQTERAPSLRSSVTCFLVACQLLESGISGIFVWPGTLTAIGTSRRNSTVPLSSVYATHARAY